MTNTKRLYRGLATGIKGWVYGSIVDNGKDRCFIIEEHLNQRVPVLYDTIGQYVPCLDAYEGDILFGSKRDSNGVLLSTWYGTVTYLDDHSRIMVVDESDTPYEVDEFKFDRVMGTVHDENHYIREQIVTFPLVRDLLHGSNAVVSHDTAATLLELSIPTFQSTISIYSSVELNIPGVYCHIVEDLDSIPQLTISGLRITNKHKTLTDLLDFSTHSEILFSSFSNYYNSDAESFNSFLSTLSDAHWDQYRSIEDDISDYMNVE